jgi:hypothetical protein
VTRSSIGPIVGRRRGGSALDITDDQRLRFSGRRRLRLASAVLTLRVGVFVRRFGHGDSDFGFWILDFRFSIFDCVVRGA